MKVPMKKSLALTIAIYLFTLLFSCPAIAEWHGIEIRNCIENGLICHTFIYEVDQNECLDGMDDWDYQFDENNLIPIYASDSPAAWLYTQVPQKLLYDYRNFNDGTKVYDGRLCAYKASGKSNYIEIWLGTSRDDAWYFRDKQILFWCDAAKNGSWVDIKAAIESCGQPAIIELEDIPSGVFNPYAKFKLKTGYEIIKNGATACDWAWFAQDWLKYTNTASNSKACGRLFGLEDLRNMKNAWLTSEDPNIVYDLYEFAKQANMWRGRSKGGCVNDYSGSEGKPDGVIDLWDLIYFCDNMWLIEEEE